MLLCLLELDLKTRTNDLKEKKENLKSAMSVFTHKRFVRCTLYNIPISLQWNVFLSIRTPQNNSGHFHLSHMLHLCTQ